MTLWLLLCLAMSQLDECEAHYRARLDEAETERVRAVRELEASYTMRARDMEQSKREALEALQVRTLPVRTLCNHQHSAGVLLWHWKYLLDVCFLAFSVARCPPP